MKKLSKLLFLIPTLITPLTLVSCKNKTPNIDNKKDENKNDDINRKLKIIKDLIFIHRNLEFENEHDETTFRSWIGDLIINQAPQKHKNNKEITQYIIQNKINLIINNIINKNQKIKDKENDEQQINEIEQITKEIIEIINEQNERINKLKQFKERDELEKESDDEYEWLLQQYNKYKRKK